MSYAADVGTPSSFDPFSLAARLRAGETLHVAWVGSPEPLTAEAVARSGFASLVLDMQHGLSDPLTVMRSIGAVAAVGKPALVRVPVGDFANASRALDFGAAGVIAPMINSVEDARAFADFMKYPPLGKRSWGPSRAMALMGEADPQRYLATANRGTLALAMIETRAALDALDGILAVEGIDGVFIGPSDLSVSLSNGAFVDQDHAIVEEPLRRVAAASAAAGKVAAIFGGSPARARFVREIGFRLISVGIDPGYITLGCETLLKDL